MGSVAQVGSDMRGPTRIAYNEAERLGLLVLYGSTVEAQEARACARALPEDAVEDITLHLLHRAFRLSQRLGDFADKCEPQDPLWTGALASIGRERDEMEGVSIVLAEAGRDSRALGLLDEIGTELVDGLLEPPCEDEWLSKSAQLDPNTWWARLVPLGGEHG